MPSSSASAPASQYNGMPVPVTVAGQRERGAPQAQPSALPPSFGQATYPLATSNPANRDAPTSPAHAHPYPASAGVSFPAPRHAPSSAAGSHTRPARGRQRVIRQATPLRPQATAMRMRGPCRTRRCRGRCLCTPRRRTSTTGTVRIRRAGGVPGAEVELHTLPPSTRHKKPPADRTPSPHPCPG
ncbi:hypothetical protein DFH07DRAFT_317202 [Mycena maculata]|uniref:Uncharacterized protein n=1 Tax=Mycena maculata TaxID=230809 RepID=A0AAD7HF88_9AGAR|nr:hypothetical protein DFH07DRAFT_317202 [Mycena maculata]